MVVVGGIVSLIIAAVVYDPSRGYGGSIFFGVVGVVLLVFGLFVED
jgi:hypothetical protein